MAANATMPTPGPFDALAALIADLVVERLKGPVATAMPHDVGIPEAARLMGLGTKKVRNMIMLGQIKAHKGGVRYLINTADIATWREGSKIKP